MGRTHFYKHQNMPSDHPKKSQQYEAGPRAWQSLKRGLEQERQALRQIRSKQGLGAAQIEQDDRLTGIDDTDLMEQMFIEGEFRYPEIAKLVERTRLSYFALLVPISNQEEEHLKELGFVRKSLLTALWELQQQVQQSFRNNKTLVITLDLDDANEVLKEYETLSGVSPKVSRLVQEIKIILSDLNQLSKQFSG